MQASRTDDRDGMGRREGLLAAGASLASLTASPSVRAVLGGEKELVALEPGRGGGVRPIAAIAR